MKNVTVSMDETVARWIRRAAADRETSVSRFVGDVLREKMAAEDQYARAMAEFMATEPTGGSGGQPLPEREARHDRAALR